MNQKMIVMGAFGPLLGMLAPVQAEQQIISVETQNKSLVFMVGNSGELFHKYYGEKLRIPEDILKDIVDDNNRDMTFEGYSTFGKNNPYETAFKATHADGNLTTDLRYLRHEIRKMDANRIVTRIFMKDSAYDFFVTLHYMACQEEDIIESWVVVENKEPGEVVLGNFASFDLVLKQNEYWLSHYYGAWASEMQLEEEKLGKGIKIIDSKKGVRTTQSENASFMLALNHSAEETEGEVIGGALAWSGNYRLCFQVDSLNQMHITAGMNPYASTYHLEPKQTFKTPKFIFSHSLAGKGSISRNFHRWARRYSLRDGNTPRPVILNSWEGAYFDFDEKKIKTMISNAALLGVEIFVLDDGWFGNKYPRNNDKAGLGDWQVNTNKLPNGIGHLIDHAEKENIKFGIWVEPEMVNPKSELAEQHPEWIVSRPNREPLLLRTQLLLDLSNPEVQEFVFKSVDNILAENPRIAYIKWDANRHVQNIGSTYLAPDRQSHFWIDYTRGLYDVYAHLMEKYPDVIFQVCSSGGGRLDYGSLPFHHEFWTSDNTDAWSRIYQQWNTSQFYPAIAMAAHVSANPNHQTKHVTPLKARFDVAMAGRLGMELQPADMTPEEFAFAKKAIETYKRLRHIVHLGDLYRLNSPYKEDRAALMYVTPKKDHALVFGFITRFHSRNDYLTVKMAGLDPSKTYQVKEINQADSRKKLFTGSGKTFSGDYLMKRGVQLKIRLQYESAVLEVVAVE